MVEPMFAPIAFFMSLMGLMIGLVGLAATIYALYDVLFRQPSMESIEKLVWVMVILVFNIIGVIAYLVLVKYMGENPVSDALSAGAEHRKIDELERLADLKERGVITAEEFRQEKERLLGPADDTDHGSGADTADTDEDTEESA